MNLWQFINVDQRLDLQGLTEATVDRFAKLLQRGHSIADLLTHYSDDFGHLPTERLSSLHNSRRRYMAWKRRKTQLEDIRHRAKLSALPEAALARAMTPDQLDAIYRTARLCLRRSFDTERGWIDALVAGLELWKGCLALCRKEGRARTELGQAADGDARRYDECTRGKLTLDDIPPHRWLAIRRGQRESALKLTLELPLQALTDQVELYRPRLGPDATDRNATSLRDELVLDDMESWLLQLLDRQAETEAIRHASASLLGLLRSSPLSARRVAGIYVGRAKAPIGVTIADREGELLAQKAVKAEGAWRRRIEDVLDEYSPSHLVVPTSAPAAELLAEIEEKLSTPERALVKIRPAALAEARRPLTDPPMRLGTSVASALVLARRALDPAKEWASVDPVSIGVAEYQNDLDPGRLRAALSETIELFRLERRKGKSNFMGTPVPRPTAGVARLNPLVKSLADLRPGMTVNGVVTNISHFGAFINVGLPQEGLAHISELSDDYVANPNDVLSIGQQVTAQVLSLDPGRGRISLSLKTQRLLLERDDRRGARSGGGGSPPKSKAEALASLEKLFKK